MTDVKLITGDKVEARKRFTSQDWNFIADMVRDEYIRRKRDRRDTDKIWKDIDRQLRMDPDVTHKLDSEGRPDPNNAWMPEMELPLQSQTLEVLTADARRMLFPDSNTWFQAHAFVTDDYLERVDFQSLIAGDRNEVPSRVDQDNADKLVQGTLDHWHRQYDFGHNMDLINAEAFKYGMGIGRARLATKSVFIRDARGVVKQDQKLPVLFPRSVKNVYLDDSEHALMNEGMLMGGSVISKTIQRWEDLVMAAKKGDNDPNKPDGGWMPAKLKGLSGNKDGNITRLELEGDLVVPRKTSGSFFIPGAIVDVILASDGKTEDVPRVVRFRFRQSPYSSYIAFPYHSEHVDTPYGSSPLMKGWPVQKAAVESLNRFLMVAALHSQPPTKYDRSDMFFASRGGPRIYPGAQWATLGDVVTEQIGEPSALFNAFAEQVRLYFDVTSVNAPRLGAQTVSHTTAFAKDAELTRGTIRTVDYVRSSLKGPLMTWLHIAYSLGRPTLTRKTRMWIDAYGGAVDITKDDLPDEAVFEAQGAGGPAEEAQKAQARFFAAQQAVALDQFKVQLGQQPTIDIEAMQEAILREGGWVDVDAIIQRGAGAAGGVTGQSQLAQPAPETGAPTATAVEQLLRTGTQ